MKLIIMRHGQAKWSAPSDAERPLTVEGIQQAQSTARQIKQLCQVSTILASPYLRAQQTADQTASLLGVEVNTMEQLTPDGDPANFIKLLPDKGNVLLVSHMPLVGELTGLLCYGQRGEGLAFATGSAVALDLEHPGVGLAHIVGNIVPDL